MAYCILERLVFSEGNKFSFIYTGIRDNVGGVGCVVKDGTAITFREETNH